MQNANETPGEVVNVPPALLVGFLQSGAADGLPVFFFHDYGGSRLSVPLDGSVAARLGVRVISMDRPGIGLSSFQADRTPLDWPDVVAHVADMLGIERFAVLGHSWGGPYALACAYKMPERVLGVGVVAGVPPFAGADAIPTPTGPFAQTVRTAQRVPWLLRPHLSSLSRQSREHPEQVYQDLLKEACPADQAILRQPAVHEQVVMHIAEPFREGTAGIYLDALVGARDWGFRLGDVTLPVHLWYGEQDPTVPPAMGHYLAERLPQASATFLPNEGHLLHYSHWGEILSAITSKR